MKVLGIESSCDETGVALVQTQGDAPPSLLSQALHSQTALHQAYGGVVPELASRDHVRRLLPLSRAVLAQAQVGLDAVDVVAYTRGPGLAGALLVGAGFACALGASLGKPVLGVHHLEGHLLSPFLARDPPAFPFVALLVSGGHTQLMRVDDVGRYELLGETIDDAAGEAFDKVARLLGLPYPGGPEIDRAAVGGDPAAIRFPRGLSLPKDLEKHRYDFSFSGLKTAVARWVERERDAGHELPLADVAASFREAVADVLLTKALAACRDLDVPRLLLGGGVVANARVRELAAQRCAAAGVELRIPPLALCTDNGAMIAALGAQLVMAGRVPSGLGFGADSTLPVTTIQA